MEDFDVTVKVAVSQLTGKKQQLNQHISSFDVNKSK